MHDPFAMRPFLGYNFGAYLGHWLAMGGRRGAVLPRIFHVNWFRRGGDGAYLWPGFGDNCRVVDWICRRVDGEAGTAAETAVGYVPSPGSLDLSGLAPGLDWEQLFALPRGFWEREVHDIRRYLTVQVNRDLPGALLSELEGLERRVAAM
ncbi:hypothetical protein chiPu_0029213 [Chiloscyllium punctatum]|uniref:Phosphoenolpyruvate carboxykinase C-terminal P-loop domain-containing protein n=1 Tax=Chiloscyllium punctatum TaxID=137246 RepID=A0A401TS51_CHIPU|nr:hypothetical protein [Chiloscyllium punctatum]